MEPCFGQLPTGLTLSNSGAVSGTPSASGSFTFTVDVGDSAASPQLASWSETIAVAAAPAAGSPSSTATLLFESDFGGNVNVGTPEQVSSCSTNNGWWPVLGGDDGFGWPIIINGGAAQGFQPDTSGQANIYYDSTTNTINSCTNDAAIWKTGIIQGARHDGTTGPVLHRANYQNMLWQLPYVILPNSDVPDQYQKVWMMLPTNLATTMGPNQWYTFAEWKTTSTLNTGENYDYRIAVFVYTDSNDKPYWYIDRHGALWRALLLDSAEHNDSSSTGAVVPV